LALDHRERIASPSALLYWCPKTNQCTGLATGGARRFTTLFCIQEFLSNKIRRKTMER